MVDLSTHLDPEANAAWNHYVRLYGEGRRGEAFQALAAFVALVRDYPSDRQAALVDALCRQTVDIGRLDLLRQPLLTEVMFPELRVGREARRPRYAKRIAMLADRIVGLPGGLEKLGLRDLRANELLEEALELEPGDADARDRLIRWYHDALEYCMHEVPSGVLAEPEELRQLLDAFERVLLAAGRTEEFTEELAEWRFHCEGWREYRSRRGEFVDYPDYLAKCGGERGI